MQPSAVEADPGIEAVPADVPEEFKREMFMYSNCAEVFAELGVNVRPRAGRLEVLDVTAGADPLVQLRVPEPAASAGAATPATTNPAAKIKAPSALREKFFIPIV